MSFFDKTSPFSSNFKEHANKKIQQQRELINRLESKSNKELINIIKSEGLLGSTDSEKNIAKKILHARGY